MATVTVPIKRQDYNSTDPGKQLNGWEPNVISGALTGEYITSADTITIPAYFKEHKTIFVINNEDSAAKTVTFKAGNSYQGVKDLAVEAAVGISIIWLDSARFVDNETGEITVTTNEATASKLSIFGYEMR